MGEAGEEANGAARAIRDRLATERGVGMRKE